MSKPVRFSAALLGFALLAYLILRAGPANIVNDAKAVGWGMALIVLLGGVSHLIKTLAWRLTFVSEIRRVSLARTFALRLGAEAAGNLGLAGQVLGDTMRVSLLRSSVPVSDGISSVALDRGLYAVTAALVSVTGTLAALLLLPFPGSWRLYAVIFAAALAAFLALTAIALKNGWPIIATAAHALRLLPYFKRWLRDKESVIETADKNLLGFYRERPAAFWASVALDLAAHFLAILEVYLLLHFMGAKITLLSAFVIEAMTKLINLVGALNPGNIGTYEGGNMLLTRLFGITGSAGLTLALCRRARALFWAAIGALCFILLSRASEQSKPDSGHKAEPTDMPNVESEPSANVTELAQPEGLAVIISVESKPDLTGFVPALARVGTLPVLLRAILAAEALQAKRIVVYLDPSDAQLIRGELQRSRRVPKAVEWRERAEHSSLRLIVREAAKTADCIMLLSGTNTYKPALLQSVLEWDGTSGALAVKTDVKRAGIYALSRAAALELANGRNAEIDSLDELYQWIVSRRYVDVHPAPADSWQQITNPRDRLAAEHKLDGWLVKPTDGLFARNNRRISIPISHQLIKFPITPNMVSLFTLGVSIAAGVFFARGGYWYMLLGAVLSVWASILDGCDGEVARLKLQSTKFGCWLETICDYLYYVIIFAGIAFGLKKNTGSKAYLVWGGVLLAGAFLSFFAVSFLRQRMSSDRPEKFLAVWQKKAETRRANPLLYVGRHCEFIIRRCFFPYALLAFALLNITKVAFVMTALGANVVWIIGLYSWFAFSRQRRFTPSRAEAPVGSQVAVKVPF